MAMTATYTTVNGQILHEDRGGTETFLVPDPLGSVIQTRNMAGGTSSTAVYWPYGEVRTSTGTNPSPWGYVGSYGYYRDSAERLYVRARYYAPGLTRWTTVDPLWPQESAYGYVADGPIISIDPTGLSIGNDLRECIKYYYLRGYSAKSACESCKHRLSYSGGFNCDSQPDVGKPMPICYPMHPGESANPPPKKNGGSSALIPSILGATSKYGDAMDFEYGPCMAACLKSARGIGMFPNWAKKTCDGFCRSLRSGGCKMLFEKCGLQQGEFQVKVCLAIYDEACFGE